MAGYIHELPAWPKFDWEQKDLAEQLASVRHRQGRLIGRMEGLWAFRCASEAVLETLTQDVLKSSEIEGEILDKDQVRSSHRPPPGHGHRRADAGGPRRRRRRRDDARRHPEIRRAADRGAPVRLACGAVSDRAQRHAARSRSARGATTRSGPMQVVSGPIGRERVHYEAPAAAQLDGGNGRVPRLVQRRKSPSIRCSRPAIAHLWFVTIHPFDDGNGRIARAIADMALARSEHSPQRFYSMSAQIRQERNDYYDMLEATQKGDLDITPWLRWFLGCLDRAFDRAERHSCQCASGRPGSGTSMRAQSFNDRQRDMLNRLLDGFEGKLTSSKWATHREMLAGHGAARHR